MSEEMKDKKVAKSEKQQAKEAKKLAKKNKPAKDHWFTISGITKEAKRVRWPHWTNQGSEEEHYKILVKYWCSQYSLHYSLCCVI